MYFSYCIIAQFCYLSVSFQISFRITWDLDGVKMEVEEIESIDIESIDIDTESIDFSH